MRNWIMVIASLLIICVGLYGSAVLLLNEERLKGLLVEQIARDSGRSIDIRGDLRVRFFPGLRLEADNVVIVPIGSSDSSALLSAQYLEMKLRLLPMIRGDLLASEVRLESATINLSSDDQGVTDFSGLFAREEAEAPGESWLAGPVLIDNVVLNFSDKLGVQEEQLMVDQIELNGFAVGEPLQFSFRGNIGDPVLFDWVEIDGLLRPRSDGSFRLANMRLSGSMEEGHFDIEMLGNLDVIPGSSLTVSLDAGQLRINEHQFSSQLRYSAGDRAYLDLALRSDQVDIDVAALPSLLSSHVGPDSASKVIAGLRAMDFDVDIQIGQVAEEGLVLKQLEMQVKARNQSLSVERLVAEVPGGYLSALGVVELAASGWSSDWGIRIDADDFAQLGQAIPVDWLPGGSGALSLVLNLTPESSDSGPSGQGAIEIWNGRWPLLGRLYPESWQSDSTDEFEFFSSPIALTDGGVTLSELQIVNSTVVAQGWLGFYPLTRAIEGSMNFIHGEDLVAALIQGSIDEPLVGWDQPQSGDQP